MRCKGFGLSSTDYVLLYKRYRTNILANEAGLLRLKDVCMALSNYGTKVVKINNKYCKLNYNNHLKAAFMILWINLFLNINRDNQQSYSQRI